MGKNIDQITRTLTTLTGAERIAVRDDSGDAKAVLDTLINLILAKNAPVGTIKDWDKTLSGTPALDATWHECDGSLVDDADSPYDGQRIRNLNGADVILTGIVWASGVATIPSADLPALAVGDYVAGSGIDSKAYITDITGTTVTMSDTSFSGTVTTTFSNDGRFVRGGETSGDGQKDQMQLITGQIPNVWASSEEAPTGVFTYNNGNSTRPTNGTTTSRDFNFSNANSPDARTSDTTAGETRPTNTTMVKIIKIKDTL